MKAWGVFPAAAAALAIRDLSASGSFIVVVDISMLLLS